MSLKNNDYCQPLKTYVRNKNVANRIIAMPAYVGGETNLFGIKWIASFPANIEVGQARANSVLILNDAQNGQPLSIINTALLSGLRTAAVSGFVVKNYMGHTKRKTINCGIIGFGPIGQLHAEMLFDMYGDIIDNIFIYDINGIAQKNIDGLKAKDKIVVMDNWENVFDGSDIFMTCTVSKKTYVNKGPKKGRLYLNVSLRDFETEFLKKIDVIIVDDWNEVCRENTDIERAHIAYGLSKNDVLQITELTGSGNNIDFDGSSVMFNPMGMSIYDIAVARYFYNLAVDKHIGMDLY
jgi:ornithine cyclodeaminase